MTHVPMTHVYTRIFRTRWSLILGWFFPVSILNVHKMFKRRLERFLNVLCTFNLHPLSAGMFL